MNTEIDFVVTWVDGNDPAWRKQKNEYSEVSGDKADVRYRDWDTLRYWFRGVEKFTPWVRKIHFITWGHIPEWLDTSNPKLNIVRHTDFIPEEYLPTFNSHTIELNMHRIEGLAESFVYFNDDMFVTSETGPELFFKDDLPCATFGLQVIKFTKNSIGWILGSNIAVINDHFNMRDVLRTHRKKVFSIKNGFKRVVKSWLLSKCVWYFSGLYDWHLAIPFKKSTFEKVWQAEPETLDETCRCRFREKDNVSPYLFEYWQLVSGEFSPRTSNVGHTYHIRNNNIAEMRQAIENKSYNLICVNDTDGLDDWEEAAKQTRESFEKILPDKCSFEK